MGVQLVEARSRSRSVTDLGMRCDERELPFPLSTQQPVQHFVGMGTFGMPADPRQTNSWTGSSKAATTAIAVSGSWIYGIWAPQTTAAPAVWFSCPVAELKVEAGSATSLIRKKPLSLIIEHTEWMLGLTNVGQIYGAARGGGRLASRQEGELLQALTAR